MLIALLLFGTLVDIASAQQVASDKMGLKGGVEETITPPCSAGEMKTAGNSSVNGPAGNIRPFSTGTINANASAFARRNSDGAWQAAYLGAYPNGIGVTDSSENGSSGTSKIDNVGTFKNYVLFEFSQQVVVDRAYIGSLAGDSDITVYIGNATDPYNNHITLNDALLNSFGSENNNGGSSGRIADVNGSGEVGNVLIIAARVDNSDDVFELEALDILCPPPPCSETKIETTGNSDNDGTDGNIRTFTSGGISVKASAFAKRNVDSVWETAFLGAFSPGLGVTDQGEGNGDAERHKVDNIGDRKNYVLFEFNQDVVVDRVFLDSIGADSDITVWIGSGTDPFNNHLTLSNALLTSFGPSEDNDAPNNSSRWADINASLEAGNVMVVAASTSDADPEDAFKIGTIEVRCADANRAKVTIIKEVFPFVGGTAATQIFGFTSTGLGTPNFGLVDMDIIGPDRFINANITAFGAGNPITVTESLTPSWTLGNLACVETGGISNSTVNFGQRKATIIAEPGESIVCKFTNTQLTPSAAYASVAGRALTADGRGIYGASLTLTEIGTGETRTVRTNPFGYYRFDEVEVGLFYVLTISHKRHAFFANTTSFTLVDELTSLDFVETF